MPKKTNIPSRVRTPDLYNYLIFDKNSFKEFIIAVDSLLKKHTGIDHGVNIRVEGFDGSFETIDTFIETLTAKEWTNLKNIRVYFYPKNTSKYGLDNSMSLRFGGYSMGAPGLHVEYQGIISDTQRITLKQDLDVIIPDYSRSPLLSDTQFSAIPSFIVSLGLILYLTSIAGEFKLVTYIIIFAAVIYAVAMVYFCSIWIHNKIYPHFETADNKNETRLKKAGKVVGVILGAFAFLGTILSFIQFFYSK